MVENDGAAGAVAADEEEPDGAQYASDPAQTHLLKKATQRIHLKARDSGLRGPKLEHEHTAMASQNAARTT